MLPAIAARISSRVGCGLAASSAVAETICPGVQKPHCSPSSATKACCSGRQPAGRDALDRHDRPAVNGADEHQAGVDRHPVEQHGAGPAGALAAAELGPGQPEVVAQHAREPPRRIDVELVALAVDVEIDPHRGESMPAMPLQLVGARTAERSTSTRVHDHAFRRRAPAKRGRVRPARAHVRRRIRTRRDRMRVARGLRRAARPPHPSAVQHAHSPPSHVDGARSVPRRLRAGADPSGQFGGRRRRRRGPATQRTRLGRSAGSVTSPMAAGARPRRLIRPHRHLRGSLGDGRQCA